MTWGPTGIGVLLPHAAIWAMWLLRHFEGPLVAVLMVAVVGLVWKLWGRFSG